LDLFGFIWPNRDFSMGYEPKNKKIAFRLRLADQVVAEGIQTPFPLRGGAAGRRRPSSALPSMIATISAQRKTM
jgi:hypothetical protein